MITFVFSAIVGWSGVTTSSFWITRLVPGIVFTEPSPYVNVAVPSLDTLTSVAVGLVAFTLVATAACSSGVKLWVFPTSVVAGTTAGFCAACVATSLSVSLATTRLVLGIVFTEPSEYVNVAVPSLDTLTSVAVGLACFTLVATADCSAGVKLWVFSTGTKLPGTCAGFFSASVLTFGVVCFVDFSTSLSPAIVSTDLSGYVITTVPSGLTSTVVPAGKLLASSTAFLTAVCSSGVNFVVFPTCVFPGITGSVLDAIVPSSFLAGATNLSLEIVSLEPSLYVITAVPSALTSTVDPSGNIFTPSIFWRTFSFSSLESFVEFFTSTFFSGTFGSNLDAIDPSGWTSFIFLIPLSLAASISSLDWPLLMSSIALSFALLIASIAFCFSLSDTSLLFLISLMRFWASSSTSAFAFAFSSSRFVTSGFLTSVSAFGLYFSIFSLASSAICLAVPADDASSIALLASFFALLIASSAFCFCSAVKSLLFLISSSLALAASSTCFLAASFALARSLSLSAVSNEATTSTGTFTVTLVPSASVTSTSASLVPVSVVVGLEVIFAVTPSASANCFRISSSVKSLPFSTVAFPDTKAVCKSNSALKILVDLPLDVCGL